jgi:hypothetical protein
MRFLFVLLCFCWVLGCKKNAVNVPTPTDSTALETFKGYKVDPIALAASRQKDFGRSYWRNNSYFVDLFITAFQKPYSGNQGAVENNFFGGGIQATAGDFNNDGYIDIFNAGGAYAANATAFSFLIWNPNKQAFIDTTLLNDKSFRTFGGNKNTSIPIYLNQDNYLDIVLFDNGDEGIPNSPNEPVRIILSDGKGGYDLKEVETNENYVTDWGGMRNFKYGNKKESGDVGDLNMDGIPDLYMVCNSQTYIYWGISEFPYFTQNNHAQNFADTVNFGYLSNNGFNEKAPLCSGNAYNAHIADVNNDNKNDIILGSSESNNDPLVPMSQRILFNLGSGRFNNSSAYALPLYQKVEPGFPINVDFLLADINDDGKKDIITTNYTSGPQGFGIFWDILIYFQNNDGTFRLDKSMFQYTTNTDRRITGEYRRYLSYVDINRDGKEDIVAGNTVGTLDKNNKAHVMYKTVFIRNGNSFIEESYYKYDNYAKTVLQLIK